MTRDEWRASLTEPARPALEGTAEVGEDLDETLDWATRIGGRYTGAERPEAFARRNAVPGEVLVRVTPTRVVAGENISG